MPSVFKIAALAALSCFSALAAGQTKPNVVFVLVDDQDALLNSLDYMPNVQKYLVDQGTSYTRHYCTVSLCCPSRVSIWTGKAAHNHNVTDVSPPYGGYSKFLDEGLNDNYLPVWLQEGGYATYYVGKLFNYQNVLTNWFKFPNGFTGTDFLIDPYTYNYWNPWFQRNKEAPKPYLNQYNTDLVAEKSLAYLEEAAEKADETPFFVTIAPVGPHAEVTLSVDLQYFTDDNYTLINTSFSAPKPADRHADLFPDADVPRTANFNPDVPSGADWVLSLPQLSAENVSSNDEWYRQRLRSLQAVDDIVGQVVEKLDSHGLLDNTYIVYTSDNGYHISNHRFPPGKGCAYEEDINVPLVIRGPGMAKKATINAPTAHLDLAPTFLSILGLETRPDFDGSPLPLTVEAAANSTTEHVQTEFWSSGDQSEWKDGYKSDPVNNTYKSLRVIADEYNLFYTVWCAGSHELYDMTTDAAQMNNLYGSSDQQLLPGVSTEDLTNRLDSLLMVLKTCAGDTCRDPWGAMIPGVSSLAEALDPQYDEFFASDMERVAWTVCDEGYIEEAEGPMYNGARYQMRP
ncbi:Arylsulphatase [Xylariomycetidae sp. FL2044]|nr:Arylsulphatase [Xylariomycetidae sp. FL2044]